MNLQLQLWQFSPIIPIVKPINAKQALDNLAIATKAYADGEIAKQLYEFKGQKNSRGKKDRLLKHVKRVEELEKDLQGLANFTSLDTKLQIKGLIVFSNIVPMVFDETRSYKEKIDFISYDDLSCLADMNERA